jgi:hypothetical protein
MMSQQTRKVPLTLFADTTVVYYRLFGPPRQQAHVLQLAREHELVLTPFVKGEFIRGYLDGLIALYFTIKEENSVRHGMQVFAADEGLRPRRLANAFTSTVDWLNQHGESEDVLLTLDRLRQYIVKTLLWFDLDFPNSASDPLRCEFGLLVPPPEAPTEDDLLDLAQRLRDIRNSPSCDQCRFRDSQIARLAASNIDIDSPAQRQRFQDCAGYVSQARMTERARNSPRTAPSCWYCDRLGDTVIALSCPAGATILTGDRQAFPALGQILGIPIQLVPSEQQLRGK